MKKKKNIYAIQENEIRFYLFIYFIIFSNEKLLLLYVIKL